MIASGRPGGRAILVDSSVWIDFYRPGAAPALRAAIVDALRRDIVHTTSLIVAEVVQGAPDEPTLGELLADFEALRSAGEGAEVGPAAARIGFALRRRGRPVPATDLLIAAAAIRSGCELWHAGGHFERIAEVAPLETRRF